MCFLWYILEGNAFAYIERERRMGLKYILLDEFFFAQDGQKWRV
jgi:hypothetical protein